MMRGMMASAVCETHFWPMKYVSRVRTCSLIDNEGKGTPVVSAWTRLVIQIGA